MTQAQIATLAHNDAAFILTCLSADEIADSIGLARECAAGRKLDVRGADGELYVARFASHIVNVQCGTNGL